MTHFFRIDGRLNQREYWRMFAELTGISFALTMFFGALLATMPESPRVMMEYVAIALILLIVVISTLAMVALFCLYIRRARDAGNAVLWTTLALLLGPVGCILLGVLSSKR